jgi:hypothetical protein
VVLLVDDVDDVDDVPDEVVNSNEPTVPWNLKPMGSIVTVEP